MAKLIWDKTGEHYYETGVSNGVVYPQNANGGYGDGEAWNGLTAVNESPSGADLSPLYANNQKYVNLQAAEEFGFTIEAYTYPKAFGECNGESDLAKGVVITQQKRKSFGFSYKTKLGNDAEGDEFGYKLHLVYGATAAPSSMDHSTVNDSPEAPTMSWECSTIPVNVEGFKPTAHLVVSSVTADSTKLKELEDILYGTAEKEPRLPLPDEMITLMGAVSEA